MRGKKISRAEFERNYENVKPEEINRPQSKPPITDEIYNPIRIRYKRILKETEKGRLFQFEDWSEYWFAKRLSIIDEKRQYLTVPRKFIEDTALDELEI